MCEHLSTLNIHPHLSAGLDFPTMRLWIDDLEVLWPYDYVYPEQYDYMCQLKTALDQDKGHCLLEMPTGTGKTVSLLSLILAYQYRYQHADVLDDVSSDKPSSSSSSSSSSSKSRKATIKVEADGDTAAATNAPLPPSKPSTKKESSSRQTNAPVGKLVYCTRTVQEMDKVVDELQRVMAYRRAALLEDAGDGSGGRAHRPMLGVCLSSRRNMCIHPDVGSYDNRNKVDAMCHKLTASFKREAVGVVDAGFVAGVYLLLVAALFVMFLQLLLLQSANRILSLHCAHIGHSPSDLRYPSHRSARSVRPNARRQQARLRRERRWQHRITAMSAILRAAHFMRNMNRWGRMQRSPEFTTWLTCGASARQKAGARTSSRVISLVIAMSSCTITNTCSIRKFRRWCRRR